MEIVLWIAGGVVAAAVLVYVLILVAFWIFVSKNPWL